MYEIIKTFPYTVQVILVLIPFVSVLIAVITFIMNSGQTRLNNKLTRAKIVSESFHKFMTDQASQKAFYLIEYNEFMYNPSNFHGSDAEQHLDLLLRHFANLAMMWERRLLSLNDIRPIQYYILRTTTNKEVIKYLNFIEKWAEVSQTGVHPYKNLNELSTALTVMAMSQK